MMFDRRTFLLAGAAFPICLAETASCASPPGLFEPEDFGALGNGRADDTSAIQRCLDAAPAGAIVRLRRGAVYRINTNYRPTWEMVGGLKLKAGQILELNGAELRALPTQSARGSVVQAFRVNGWEIRGPGRIVGERSIHLGTGGEWGMGLSAWSSSDWVIAPGVEISNCWGDGLYVGHAPDGGFCERFLVDQIRIRNCRRNGISVTGGRDGEIRSVDIQQIDGTAPFGGIDLEPDRTNQPNRRIRIRGGRMRDVGVGVYVTVANEDVLITGLDVEAKNSGIIIGDNSRGVRIEGNPSIRSLEGGTEGAAIRSVGNVATVRDVRIRNNGLFGGGYFVVDIFSAKYPGLEISGNRIHASNPGVQGVARISSATFADNVCTIEPAAGKAGEFFMLFEDVSYGGNRYRNRSGKKMFALIRRGRQIAEEAYEAASLTKAVQP